MKTFLKFFFASIINLLIDLSETGLIIKGWRVHITWVVHQGKRVPSIISLTRVWST